jgi:hypothetical protein
MGPKDSVGCYQRGVVITHTTFRVDMFVTSFGQLALSNGETGAESRAVSLGAPLALRSDQLVENDTRYTERRL